MWKTLACAVFILAGTAGVVAPSVAHAQPAPTDAKAAEELAQQAFDAYQKGDFGAAIALYKKAYQASAAGVILFNIANIYDKKLKDKDSAADYYRKYLRSGDTEPELVKRASERLDTVRAEIEAGKQAQQDERNANASSSRPGNGTTATPNLTLSPPPSRPSPPLAAKQKLGIAAGIAGVVGLGVSGYFGYQARKENQRADKGCNGLTACPDAFGLGASNTAHRDATISTVSFVAGAALVATGVVLYIYGPSKKEGTIIGLTPQLGGLAITGAWQ